MLVYTSLKCQSNDCIPYHARRLFEFHAALRLHWSSCDMLCDPGIHLLETFTYLDARYTYIYLDGHIDALLQPWSPYSLVTVSLCILYILTPLPSFHRSSAGPLQNTHTSSDPQPSRCSLLVSSWSISCAMFLEKTSSDCSVSASNGGIPSVFAASGLYSG